MINKDHLTVVSGAFPENSDAERNPVLINKNHLTVVSGASTEIRTPVLALKGLRPGPLDDGGVNERYSTIG